MEKWFKLAPVIIGVIVLGLVYQYYSEFSYKKGFTGRAILDPACNLNSTVTLGVAEAIVNDGDAYIDENSINPNWVWFLSSLDQLNPLFAVENNFSRIDFASKPVTLGGCYTFPNNYASACLNDLTVSNSDYRDLRVRYDIRDTLASGHLNGMSSANTIYISVLQSPATLLVNSTSWSAVNSTNNVNNRQTSKVWLQRGLNLVDNTGQGNLYQEGVLVFFEDSYNPPYNVIYGGILNTTLSSGLSFNIPWIYLENISTSNDVAEDISLDTQNNVYVAGWSGPQNGDSAMSFFKLNSNGVPICNYSQNPSVGADKAYAIAVDPSNRIYMAGSENNDNIIRVTRVNSTCFPRWNYTEDPFPGALDNVVAMSTDNDNNTYVAGYVNNANMIKVIKITNNGAHVWNNTYDPSIGIDYATSINIDSNNNVYVGAMVNNDQTLQIIKLNSSGSNIWTYSQSFSGGYISDVKADSNGDIVATGYKGTSMYVFKLSSAGGYLWNYTDNAISSVAKALTIDNNDNIYVAGYQDSGNKIRIIKLNSSGSNIWNYVEDPSNSIDDINGIDYGSGFLYVAGTELNSMVGRVFKLNSVPNMVSTYYDYKIANFNYENTSGNNLIIQYIYDGAIQEHKIRLNFSGDTVGVGEKDYIDLKFGISNNEFYSLGNIRGQAEADELIWRTVYLTPVNLGIDNRNSRGLYGEIIQNPSLNSLSDTVLVTVPNDQVFANVTVYGSDNRGGFFNIPLGSILNLILDKSLIPSLQDMQINFQGQNYPIKDIIILRNLLGTSPSIETSLSSEEIFYNDSVFLEADIGSLIYLYSFTNLINTLSATKQNPLSITLLGNQINISEILSSSSFKTYDTIVNPKLTNYILNTSVLDIPNVNLTLEQIKLNSVVVSVDGLAKEIINGDIANVNGFIVSVEDINGCLFGLQEQPIENIIRTSGVSSSLFKKHFNRIAADKEIMEVVSKLDLDVTKLIFILRKGVFDLDLEIKKLNRLPSNLQGPDYDDIYQFFNIEFSDLVESDFIKSIIEFRVKKSWLNNRGYNNENNIRLLKYDNGWKVLDTFVESSDDTYIYYSAETDGFSNFAIVLEERFITRTQEPEELLEAYCGNGRRDAGETCLSCAIDVTCPSGQECKNGVCTTITVTPPTSPPRQLSPPPIEEKPTIIDYIKNYIIYILIGIGIIILVILIIIFTKFRKKKTFSR